MAKFGFSRWNFQFEIDGENTLDAVNDHGLLRRIAGRQKLFMDPLIASGYLRGKRVLDLGCNSGYWSLLAVRDGGAAFVHGAEAAPELVQQANFVFKKYQIPEDRYRFDTADAYRFLENCEPFDVILCLGFFYHINDPIRLLKLMSDKTTGYVIVDTVIHNSEDALISLRPVQRKWVIDEANITLELVSSQKAIYWMAEETGFKQMRRLKADYEKVSSMWDYLANERAAFVLSKGPEIETVWPNTQNMNYLSIQEDLSKFGYFPEMRNKRQLEKQ